MRSPGFAAATAVTRRGDGRYAARIHDGWDIGGNTNGGYVLAIAARAMSEELGRPPLTVTCHYLRPVPPDVDVEIEVTPVRIGRRMATVDATMSIGGEPVLALLGTFAELPTDGPEHHAESPTELPAYVDCAAGPDPSLHQVPTLMARLSVRLRPGDEGFQYGRKSGSAEFQGWFALSPDENGVAVAEQEIDAIGLMLAVDAFPPPVFQLDLPIAWVPTIELTAHVRGVPAPGPLQCRFRSRFISGGLLDSDGEIWDSTGALVAVSRQLALTPR